MCCEPQGADGEVDGVCPECGADTVDRVSTEICGYSPVACEVCGNAPCDWSC